MPELYAHPGTLEYPDLRRLVREEVAATLRRRFRFLYASEVAATPTPGAVFAKVAGGEPVGYAK